MIFTDSHCHLASHRFSEEERVDLIQRAKGSNIGRLITLATGLEDLQENLQIASSLNIQAALGIHPCDVHSQPDDAVAQIANYLDDARVGVVGETGLDYYHPAPDGWDDEAFRERQRKFLRQHFEIAAEKKLNIVLHTRDQAGDQSFQDALAIYQDFRSEVRAVFHCYIGTWENTQKVFKAGGVVSFGGVATFKKSEALREVIRKCPKHSFMLETDSPYLAPEPFRGKRNEPAYIAKIAERIAACRGESLDELSQHTEQLVNDFFQWNS